MPLGRTKKSLPHRKYRWLAAAGTASACSVGLTIGTARERLVSPAIFLAHYRTVAVVKRHTRVSVESIHSHRPATEDPQKSRIASATSFNPCTVHLSKVFSLFTNGNAGSSAIDPFRRVNGPPAGPWHDAPARHASGHAGARRDPLRMIPTPVSRPCGSRRGSGACRPASNRQSSFPTFKHVTRVRTRPSRAPVEGRSPRDVSILDCPLRISNDCLT